MSRTRGSPSRCRCSSAMRARRRSWAWATHGGTVGGRLPGGRRGRARRDGARWFHPGRPALGRGGAVGAGRPGQRVDTDAQRGDRRGAGAAGGVARRGCGAVAVDRDGLPPVDGADQGHQRGVGQREGPPVDHRTPAGCLWPAAGDPARGVPDLGHPGLGRVRDGAGELPVGARPAQRSLSICSPGVWSGCGSRRCRPRRSTSPGCCTRRSPAGTRRRRGQRRRSGLTTVFRRTSCSTSGSVQPGRSVRRRPWLSITARCSCRRT